MGDEGLEHYWGPKWKGLCDTGVLQWPTCVTTHHRVWQQPGDTAGPSQLW